MVVILCRWQLAYLANRLKESRWPRFGELTALWWCLCFFFLHLLLESVVGSALVVVGALYIFLGWRDNRQPIVLHPGYCSKASKTRPASSLSVALLHYN